MPLHAFYAYFALMQVTVFLPTQVPMSVKSRPTKHRQKNDTGGLIFVDADRSCQHKYNAQ